MKAKKVCLVLCHPSDESFNSALSRNYISGAKKHGHEVRVLDLYNMQFDPILRDPLKFQQADEPSILEARRTIQ